MPAASDSAARMWRPHGTRIAGALAIVVLIVATGIAWYFMGERVQDTFNWAMRLTVIGIFGAMGAGWWAMARSRIVAADSGVTLVNGWRVRRFEWAQIVSLRLRQGAPWAELDLADGATLPVFGVQGSDGQRAMTAVAEFRAVMAEHSPPDRG